MVDNRRFCHANGLGDLSVFGDKVATCGGDCDVRIVSATDDSYCKDFTVDSDFCHCVATWPGPHGPMIAVGTDDFSVKIFTEHGVFNALLFRFNGVVNHMDVSKSRCYLAAGSSDFQVRVATLEDMHQHAVLTGHKAAVLSVKISPDEKNVASVSCDGSVRIWSLDSKQCVITIDCFPKANDISVERSLGRMSWEQHCDGVLVVPCGLNGIKCFANKTWQEKNNFLTTEKDMSYSTSCWSPCGNFLASGTNEGFIVVWDAAKKLVCQRVQPSLNVAICAVEFVEETIVAMDTEGYISFIAFEPVVETAAEIDGVQSTADPMFEDDLDFDTESRGSKRFCPDDDLASLTSDPVVLSRVPAKVYKDKPKTIAAFQPTEAPRDLANRFMVYNLVGLVRSHHNGASGVSSVEVEFHDVSLHHSLTIPNQCGYEMATLTRSALCLACASAEERGSLLHCVCFLEQDAGREWTLPMPKKEEIKALAQGDGWVAVATSKQFVRVISIGGVQQQVFSIPGPAVTLEAHGGRLAVVFHDSAAQCKLWIVDVSGPTPKVRPAELPLSPEASLKWVGFSPSGLLASYDSGGVLRVAVGGGLAWVPLLDAKADLGKHDTYFAVGLSEDPEEFRCILCRGTSHPVVQPRPIMVSLQFRVPLCELTTEKGKLEEEYVQISSLDPSEANTLVRTLMKMFAIACKCGRKRRALDVAEMFPAYQMLELPMNYCKKNQLHSLRDNIAFLMEKKKRREMSELEDGDDDDFEFESLVNNHSVRPHSPMEPPELVSKSEHRDEIREDKPVLASPFTSQSSKIMPKPNLNKSYSNPFKISEAPTPPVQAKPQSSGRLFHAMAASTGKLKTTPSSLTATGGNKEKQAKVQRKLKGFAPRGSSLPVGSATDSQKSGESLAGFNKWFEEMKGSLSQQHPEDSDLQEVGTRQWSQMSSEERAPWSQAS